MIKFFDRIKLLYADVQKDLKRKPMSLTDFQDLVCVDAKLNTIHTELSFIAEALIERDENIELMENALKSQKDIDNLLYKVGKRVNEAEDNIRERLSR